MYGQYGPLDTLLQLYNPFKGGVAIAKWLEAGRPWVDGNGQIKHGKNKELGIQKVQDEEL